MAGQTNSEHVSKCSQSEMNLREEERKGDSCDKRWKMERILQETQEERQRDTGGTDNQGAENQGETVTVID